MKAAGSFASAFLLRASVSLAALLVVFGAIVATNTRWDFASPLGGALMVIGRISAVTGTDAKGKPTLATDPWIDDRLARDAGFWIFLRSSNGGTLMRGPVPTETLADLGNLDTAGVSGSLLFRGDSRYPAMAWARHGDVTAVTGGFRTALPELARFMFDLVVRNVLIASSLPLIVVGFALLWAYRDYRRSLVRLSDAAATLKPGSPSRQISIDAAPPELKLLITVFNDMLAQLDRTARRHRRFAADVAHELRTPLAILRMRAEELPDTEIKSRLIGTLARLSDVVVALLDLARVREKAAKLIDVDLVVIARDAIVERAPSAVSAGHLLALEAANASVIARADPVLLGIVLGNVLDNAIRHAGSPGTITIRVLRPAIIEIEDRGSGLPVEGRDGLFDPFARGNGNGDGTGLGLTLVAEILERQGGLVELADTPAGGATVRIILASAGQAAVDHAIPSS